MAKYGMSLVTLGLAEELRGAGIAANSLWPRTTIATAAIANLLGGDEAVAGSRTPEIMSDAAYAVLVRDPAPAPATSSSTTRCWPRRASRLDQYRARARQRRLGHRGTSFLDPLEDDA
jgi:citronellol/citronellal dehydrogenase